MSRTASRSSKLSSVSENGAGGDDGGKEEWESRRAGVGRAGDDPAGGETDLWRLEPLGAVFDCMNVFLLVENAKSAGNEVVPS